MVYLHNTKEGGKTTTTEEEVVWMASMRPKRPPSKPLHNFILPSDLRWGNQKQLRCMKVNSNDDYDYEEIPAAVYRHSSFGAQFSSKKASDSLRKRKEREIFVDDPPLVSSDSRSRSHFKKAGFDFNGVTPPARKFRSSESEDDEGNGIAAVREKLMIDIRTAADKMKGAILKEDMETVEQYCNNSSSPEPAAAPASMAADLDGIVRPWTLRTRRAACKSPAANDHVPDCVGEANGAAGRTGKGSESDVMKSTNNKNPRLRSSVPAVSETLSSDKKERIQFSVALTKSEIEEDFLALSGRKPHRRPRKRPRCVQKQLDTLFPGLWLTEVTADMYKVAESQ